MPPKKNLPDITKIKFAVWAKPGKAIWVQVMDYEEGEPKEYLKGRIDQIFEEKKMASIIYDDTKGEKEVYANEILERAEEPQVLQDLVDVDPLNDAELLRCLHMRFQNDDIYCYCGPTLLATNPYKKIPKAATNEDLEMFKKYALNGGKRYTLPHIWNLAATTFYQLFENQRNQAVCISGESGAGKTVGTKLCMAFITGLFPPEDESEIIPIEDRILDCNPILESFGNAKTVRNDNSSRFGKYFIMYVSRKDKHIKGAEIKNYLLEKSRIVVQAETERNYHVFYCILKYMEPARLKQYGYANNGDATDMKQFNYLRKSKCYDVPTVNDREFYDDTCNSFNRLNFDKEEQDAVFKMIATTLNLGNVDIDPSCWVEGDNPCGLISSGYLDRVLDNLGLNDHKSQFISGIVSKRVITPDKKVIMTPRSPAQAEGIKDALAKDIFNNVFNWIVRKLNNNLLPKKDDDGNDFNLAGMSNLERSERLKKEYLTVGLLDIFGFEDFQVNSIEQFCINYTNEKLQNLYISYVFKAERTIFEQEGLAEFLTMIKYTDNMPIIEMLDKKPNGIYHLLDSVGKMAQDDGKDDAKFVDQVQKTHGKCPYMFWHKMDKTKFGIKHTAKDVYYYSVGFIEKNKDELPEFFLETLNKGNNVIMRIFNNKLTDDEVMEEKVANPQEKFLGYKFRMNMQDLMDELNSCECNFVRCIKPNEVKRKDFWVSDLALKQIRYLGVLDSIKVRKDSLPIRKIYKEFYSKYQDLDDISEQRNVPFLKLATMKPDFKTMSKNAVKSAAKDAKHEDILYGTGKVFMSVNFFNRLEEILEEKQKIKRDAVEKIANAFKVYNSAEKWEKYRKTSVKVVILGKSLFGTWNSKVEYVRFKKNLLAVRQIQLNFRQIKYRRAIREQKHASQVIGRSYRMFKIRETLFASKNLINVISNCAKKIMLRAFMAKMRINKRAINDVFELAWLQIEVKMKIDSSLTIQRIFRGHSDRLDASEQVARLQVIKAEVKKNRAANTIQKISKGFIVRSRLDRLNRAAGFIQGYTRMLWLSKYFQEMKLAARKVQKAVRKYLLKRNQTDERMSQFLISSKQYIANLRVIEHDVIFRQKDSFDQINNIENYTKVKYFEDEKSFKQSIPHVSSFIPNPPSIDLNPKMRMFSVLIDFDCQVDTSDVYENSWAVDFLNFFQNVKQNNSRLLHLEVGESFTFAVTDDFKIYSWGLNDYCQLARKVLPNMTHNYPAQCKIFSEINPRLLSSGDEHTVMVDYCNETYVWGGNMAGQLGIGHSREPRSVIKLTSLKQGVKYVASKGRKSYLVTNDGKLYSWPNKDVNSKFSPALCKVIDSNISFSQVSCGQNFAVALTCNGLLYSRGTNNYGQLGLGDLRSREEFTLIDSLKDYGEKTVEISCGHQHSACKTATGKVFTWGSGLQGQLGVGSKKQAIKPVLVKAVEATLKAKSVQAGYYATYILFENRKVYQAGSVSATNSENMSFKLFNYEQKVFGEGKLKDEFTPLKLYTKWSKSISVTYLVVGDFRDVNQNKNIRDKITSQVNTKWEESYNQTRFVCPKYIKKINTEQKLAVTSRANLMQSTTPGSTNHLGATQTSGGKTYNESSYQKSQKAMKGAHDINVQQPALPVKVTRFDDSLQNLAETNRKLENLMHKPRSQWTADDKKLVSMAKSMK